jgi:hypothetical protein
VKRFIHITILLIIAVFIFLKVMVELGLLLLDALGVVNVS